MVIAYLINQYPVTTHSFIRREIAGLEACGAVIRRFAIRRPQAVVAGEWAGSVEQMRTRVILDVGAGALLLACAQALASRPLRVARALGLAAKIGWRSERGLLRHLAYLAEACVLLRWLLGGRVDHVHAHFGTNAAAVAMLCRALGGPPFSFTTHGSADVDKAEGMALREKIDHASFVVAVCEFGRAQLYRLCDREQWPKLRVVHCGVDDAFLEAPPLPVPSAARLVCIGRLAPEKGHIVLLDAAHQLLRQGLEFELVFVGDGPLRSEIERLIEALGLQGRVKVTGWATQEDVRRHITEARALVLPSFYEGLPTVIMEAFALGRPVVATYVGGVPELVEAGASGWLVPAGSLGALAAAMREVLEAPVERLTQMGTHGAKRVAEQHDARVEARKLASLFRASIGTTLCNTEPSEATAAGAAGADTGPDMANAAWGAQPR